jgi:hypothetical protein
VIVIDLKPCLFLSISPLPLCHILQPERSPSTFSMGPQRLPIALPAKLSHGRCFFGWWSLLAVARREGSRRSCLGLEALTGWRVRRVWGAWGAWATQRRTNRSTQGQIVSRVLDASKYTTVLSSGMYIPFLGAAQYIQHGGMGAHALTQQNTTRISRIRAHRFPSPGSNIVNFDPNIMPGRSRVSSIEGTPRDTAAVPDAQVPFMP